MTRSAKVTIRLENQSAYVQNLPVHLIDDILGCERRVSTQAADGTLVWHMRRVRPWESSEHKDAPPYTEDGVSEVRIPRGLAVSRLIDGLMHHHIPHVLDDGWFVPSRPLRRNNTVLKTMPDDDAKWNALWATLQTRSGGWVVCDSTHDRTAMMASVIAYFFNASVLIVTKNHNRATELANRLESELHLPVGVGVDVNWAEHSRIHVRSSSAWFAANDDDWQVVLFDDISAAVSESAFSTLLYMDRTLRFGFVCRREIEKLDEFQRIRAEALCGPIDAVTMDKGKKTPIIQMMAENGRENAEYGQELEQKRKSDQRLPGTSTKNKKKTRKKQALEATDSGELASNKATQAHNPKHGPQSSTNSGQTTIKKRTGKRGKLVKRENTDDRAILERKRTEVWKNQELNRRIGDVARAIRTRKESKLKEMGCSAVCKPLRACKTHGKPKVAILVESAEHAHELKKLLSKWTLLQKAWASKDESKSGKDKSHAPRKPKMCERVIVTETYVAYNHLDVDVVVVASGSVNGHLRMRKAASAGRTGNGLSTQLVVNARDMEHAS